jgi:hypothetical protein
MLFYSARAAVARGRCAAAGGSAHTSTSTGAAAAAAAELAALALQAEFGDASRGESTLPAPAVAHPWCMGPRLVYLLGVCCTGRAPARVPTHGHGCMQC